MHSYLETLWNTSVDGILAVDDDGTIVAANPSAQGMLGYEDALVGMNVEQLLPTHLRDAHVSYRHGFQRSRQPRRMSSGHLLALTKSGDEVSVDISLTPVPDAGLTIALIRDATATRELEAMLRYKGFHDALTGLYNRGFYQEELDRIERSRSRPVSIIIVDVNDLKVVNDRFGHAEGDRVLQAVAKLLSEVVRAEDVLARIGGDEFAIVLKGVDAETVTGILERIHLKSVNIPYGFGLAAGAATGRAGDYIADVVRWADVQMYQVKRRQKMPR